MERTRKIILMQHLLNRLNLMDCMEGMKQFPDKYFELAITDPPYGINIGTVVGGASRSVIVGGERLSRPKFIRGLMILKPQTKIIFRSFLG